MNYPLCISHLFPFFSTMVGLFLFLKLIISLSFFSLFSIFIFKLLHNPSFLPLAIIYAQFSLIQNTKSKQNDIFKVIFPSASDCLLLPTAFTSVIQNRLIRQNIQNLLTCIPHTYMYNILYIYIIYNILYTHTHRRHTGNFLKWLRMQP